MDSSDLGKKCPGCGHVNPANFKFCPECGKALIKGKINEDTKPIPRSSSKIPILLVFLFLVIAVLGIWFTPTTILPQDMQNAIEQIKSSQTPTPTLTATASATAIPPTLTATSTPEPTSTITNTPTPLPLPPAVATVKATWVSPVDGMTMVYIPKDLYLIGALDSDTQAWINEKPQHPVNLSGYWMDKTEVTNAMYAKCVLSGACPAKKNINSLTRYPYYGNEEFDNFPVLFVSWNEANNYCTWAGRKLPTEAQWEAAARGDKGRKYPWGNNPPTCSVVNFASRIVMSGGKSSLCVGDTSVVGKYPQGASPFGLLDMSGNVWEWVADWVSPNYSIEPNQDPIGPIDGEKRVMRGGGFFTDAKYVRTTMRSWQLPDYTSNDVGFRCAR